MSFENGYRSGTIEVVLCRPTEGEFEGCPFEQTVRGDREIEEGEVDEIEEVPVIFIAGGLADCRVECQCGRTRGFSELMEDFSEGKSEDDDEDEAPENAFGLPHEDLVSLIWLDESERLLGALARFGGGLTHHASHRFVQGCYELRQQLVEEQLRRKSSLLSYLPVISESARSYLIARWVAPAIVDGMRLYDRPSEDMESWSILHHLTSLDAALLKLIAVQHRPAAVEALVRQVDIVRQVQEIERKKMDALQSEIQAWKIAFEKLSPLEKVSVEVHRREAKEKAKSSATKQGR